MDTRSSRRKFLRLGGLAFTSAFAGCNANTSGTKETPTQTDSGPETFVSTDGSQFSVNGNTWYFNGAQYSTFYAVDDDAVRAELLEEADRLNINVFRAHGGCAGRGPVNRVVEPYTLQPDPGEYNEAAFKLLDRAIAQSKQYGIRWILWLANNWRTTSNGAAQYVQWATGDPIPEGGSLMPESPVSTKEYREYHDRFYSNEQAKQLYKDYVRTVLTRTNTVTGVEYRNDPSIVMWELLNEGQALAKNQSAYLDWVEEMAAFISDLAPQQLVGSGGLGTYTEMPDWATDSDTDWFPSGTAMDYVTVNSIDDIDACSFHTYADGHGGHWDLSLEETERWIRGHVEDAHETVGKPAYNGEWGYAVRRNKDQQRFSLKTRNRMYEQYYNWYDEYDLNGSIVYQLSPGELSPRRLYSISCPQDEQTCRLIESYGSQVSEKSGSDI